MRTIHVVIPVAILFGAAGIVGAQGEQPAMVGMPEYSIGLSGTPEDPVIENHSGRVIIGYNIETADSSGRTGGIGQILALSVLPAGLPDGKSLYAMGNFPVDPQDPNSQRRNRAVSRARAVRATLTSVIFADGHFVGVDERGAFERLSQQIKTAREVGMLAKTGAWDQLDALALSPGVQSGAPPGGEDPSTYFERRSIATRLVEVWKFKGEAAAQQLAEIYSSLPTLWK